MNSRLLSYNIRFNLRKKLWFSALSFLAFLFVLPINAGMTMPAFAAHRDASAAARISEEISRFFAPGSNVSASIIFCIAAFAAGLIFFTWMHHRSQVDFYHSLPCSRTRLLGGNYLAGALAVLLPYLLNLLLTLIVIAAMRLLPLCDFGALLAGAGVNILLFLLIYTLTVLAVVLTGNGVVSGLLALVFLSFGPALFQSYLILRRQMQPTWFSATDWVQLTGHSSPVARYITLFTSESGVGWLEALIMAALIALLFVAAVLLYRRRPSEAAGRALAFPASRPWIKYPLVVLCAVGFGIFLHWLGDIESGSWLWFFIGALLGGLIAGQLMEIIYHADFRAVKKRLAPLAVTMALVLGCCGLFVADVWGYNSYLPQRGEVARVELLLDGFNSYTSSNMVSAGVWGDNSFGYRELRDADYQQLRGEVSVSSRLSRGQISDPAAIEAALAIAAKCIAAEGEDSPDSSEDYWMDNYYTYPETTAVYIRYHLSDGRTVTRQYCDREILSRDLISEMTVIYADEQYRSQIYQLFSFDPQRVRFAEVHPFEATHLVYGNEDLYQQRDCSELLAALQRELTAWDGEMMRRELPVGTVSFRVYADDPSDVPLPQEQQSFISFSYPVYADFSETIAQLENYGIEASYWQPDAEAVTEAVLCEYSREGFSSDDLLPVAPSGLTPIISYNSETVVTMVAGNTPVTLLYNEGHNRETTYTDSRDINWLMGLSHHEGAFRYNSFVVPSGELQVMLQYRNSYGAALTTNRYIIEGTQVYGADEEQQAESELI